MTGIVMLTRGAGCGGNGSTKNVNEELEEQNQVSLVELLISALRKSMVACRVEERDDGRNSICLRNSMEIGWPTNVQHLTHVTFDRFHGFLGLPIEFQVEIPSRVPSASVSVFGVSAESMQCAYDSRGNSVPTILLLMQERLYAQGGLKAEGIFRINAENTKEEEVRDQLNRGMVPEDIEVHCLAGLIKAWFRELPCGVLDGLSPEDVLRCNTEEDCAELVKHLKPTESALLNWAVDLMSDVVEHEDYNKMNARNIAMVFAPNMTQMSDPLTALMHAVQVMNLLKTLITKTLRDREDATTTDGEYSPMSYRSDRHSVEEDSQEEMETSCELRRQPSSSEEDNDNEEDEVESLSEIEENFMQQLMENENAKDCFKKELGNLVKQRASPTSGFDFQEELSSSVITDGYGSGMSVSPDVGTKVEMMNNIVECVN
ncbi:rho GTPase-activating protein 2-like [Rutidosis leptorrhynchoides]|uniref:rho GTPase-activating protein 2-like n=1 Tax=Rutidosis leptorrhynchoides TaxID=125765 RepID=UPI003A9A3BAF